MKENYTSKEMLNWRGTFGGVYNSYRFATNKLQLSPTDPHKIKNGIYLRNAQTISVYKNNEYHNDSGPANILLSTKDKVIYKDYYLNGKILEKGDIILKMILAKEKRLQ